MPSPRIGSVFTYAVIPQNYHLISIRNPTYRVNPQKIKKPKERQPGDIFHLFVDPWCITQQKSFLPDSHEPAISDSNKISPGD
jgi:hypothetical protein